jgi:hypothetical protein
MRYEWECERVCVCVLAATRSRSWCIAFALCCGEKLIFALLGKRHRICDCEKDDTCMQNVTSTKVKTVCERQDYVLV